MKNRLHTTNNDSGFIFPTVLLYTAIILLFLLTGIHKYKLEQKMTHNLIGQLHNETLLQMSRKDITAEFGSSRPESTVVSRSYSYPAGTVHVKLKELSKTTYLAEEQLTADAGTYQVYMSIVRVPPPPEPPKEPDDDKLPYPDNEVPRLPDDGEERTGNE